MKAVPLAVSLLLLAFPFAHGEPGRQPPKDRQVEDPFRTFLNKHCQECHSGKKPKGDFSLDQLAPDFDNAANRERWLAALKLRSSAIIRCRSFSSIIAGDMSMAEKLEKTCRTVTGASYH